MTEKWQITNKQCLISFEYTFLTNINNPGICKDNIVMVVFHYCYKVLKYNSSSSIPYKGSIDQFCSFHSSYHLSY